MTESFTTTNDNKLTCISHIYNEEYLLPYWLNHHKHIFDHGIIINYFCTDKSLEICREICPTWEIINTKNDSFDANKVDMEVMEIEKTIPGYKIALNVTEFLMATVPIKSILSSNSKSAISIKIYAPYSLKNYEPSNIKELLKNLINDDIKFNFEKTRGNRLLHNYEDGKYIVGRHCSHHQCSTTDMLTIVWCGFYPMNEKLMQRKLQIQKNIPENDKKQGLGYQHLWDRNRIMEENKNKYANGKPLQEIKNTLYEFLKKSVNV